MKYFKLALFEDYKKDKKENFNFPTFMSVFNIVHFLIKRKISGKLTVYYNSWGTANHC